MVKRERGKVFWPHGCIATVRARFARVGDLHERINDVAHDLTPLLEMADRDEREHGLGDAPYPPNFPKMEGEPSRVQPSRARKSD